MIVLFSTRQLPTLLNCTFCFLFFFLFLSIAIAASSSSIPTLSPLTFDNALPQPTCFDSTTHSNEPNVQDCLYAADQYRRDAFYHDNITYTVWRPRVGHQADRAMPLTFLYKTCMLYIAGRPNTVDEKFSLESQWPRISLTINQCLIAAKPGRKFGGYIDFGRPQARGAGFVAVLGGRPDDPDFEKLNGTDPWAEVPNSVAPTPETLVSRSEPPRPAEDQPNNSSTSPPALNSNETSPEEQSQQEEEAPISSLPATPTPSLEPTPLNADVNQPTCFEKTAFYEQPEDADCLATARLFRRDTDYTQNLTYSEKFPPPAGVDRSTPVFWYQESCLLFLDAERGSADQTFSLESIWPSLSAVLYQCLLDKKPGYRYGGKIFVLQEEGFYLWLGGQPNDPKVRRLGAGRGGGGGGEGNTTRSEVYEVS